MLLGDMVGKMTLSFSSVKKISSSIEANHYAVQNGQNQLFGSLKSNFKKLQQPG